MPHNRYLPHELSRAATLRLFCFPYAGGGTAVYHRWRRSVPASIDVVPINLPGREARSGERPHTDLRFLVAEIADAVAPFVDRPFALLGHSMGATIAFELARELRRRSEPLPSLLIAAASPAPHRPRKLPRMHDLHDAEFVAEVSRQFDGIPPAVRENEELLRLLLPALRADIEMLEAYSYLEESPLAVDILAIGGTEDHAVSATDLAEWSRHTMQRFSSRLLPGGHFFLFPGDDRANRSSSAALRVVVGQLEAHMAP